jgi:hypothetical protein
MMLTSCLEKYIRGRIRRACYITGALSAVAGWLLCLLYQSI